MVIVYDFKAYFADNTNILNIIAYLIEELFIFIYIIKFTSVIVNI